MQTIGTKIGDRASSSVCGHISYLGYSLASCKQYNLDTYAATIS